MADDAGIPEPYSKITTPANEIPTIGREGDTGHIVGVGEGRTGDLTGDKVPNLHDDVRAGGGKEGAIGRYGDRGDDVCMGFHGLSDLFAGDDVPDAHCTVVGRGDELTGVGSVDDASYVVVVAFHRAEEHLTNVRITDAHGFVVGDAGDLETVGGVSEGI